MMHSRSFVFVEPLINSVNLKQTILSQSLQNLFGGSARNVNRRLLYSQNFEFGRDTSENVDQARSSGDRVVRTIMGSYKLCRVGVESPDSTYAPEGCIH